MSHNKQTHMLLILDGWGIREDAPDNAISVADTPHYDALLSQYPHAAIATSGLAVGLPEGQMGNSEVGHMNIGAGRVVYQDFTKITQAIEDKQFGQNPAIHNAIQSAVDSGNAVHIMGLLSPGGVHSHEDHIFEAIRAAAAQGAQQIYLHAFLDGRDTPPKSAQSSIDKVEALFAELGVGRIASMVGRYYAMDRDNRWDRVEKAYRAITAGEGAEFDTPTAALEAAYADELTDEFVPASIILQDGESATVQPNDAVLFMNFRADRARELTHAMTQTGFDGFEREAIEPLHFVAMTEYEDGIEASIAYPPEDIHNSLGEVMAAHDMTQLRIAETEKYAHVTFFFNGGREDLFEGESRELVKSPDVATYDLQPSMSVGEVIDKLEAAIKSGDYDLIVCNLANPDMVGHTGVMDAAVSAVEAIDAALGRLEAAILSVDGRMLVTADHGNIEMMKDPKTGQPHTAHTTNLVPLIFVANDADNYRWDRDKGALCDLAPTLLKLMNVDQPDEMSGQSLLMKGS